MSNLTQANIAEFLDGSSFISKCFTTLHKYTNTIIPIMQSLHTEMASFQQSLQELSNPCGNTNSNRLSSRLIEPLLIFSETQQQLSELVYDTTASLISINQSVNDIEQTYITPLHNSLTTYQTQSWWNVWNWWTPPPKDYSDSTKVQLTLSLGIWEFKLKLGSVIESFYRMFQDGAIFASGNNDFIKTMTRTRIEKTKYYMNYKRCDGGYLNKSLGEILQKEDRIGSIPTGVENIIENIKNDGYTTYGIFRLSPSDKDINGVFPQLGVLDFEGYDFILVGAVLKRFFRNLPTKLFDEQSTEKALTINQTNAYDIRSMKMFIKGLPKYHGPLVKELFGLFYKINTYSNTNKMNSQNLSIIWVPCLFEINQNDPVAFSKGLNDLKPFFVALVEKYYDIFPDATDRKSLRMSTYRKSFHERTVSRSQTDWSNTSSNVSVNIK